MVYNDINVRQCVGRKNFAIPPFAKIDLTKILTVKNLTKIYRASERPKLSRNLPKIFPKLTSETPVKNNRYF